MPNIRRFFLFLLVSMTLVVAGWNEAKANHIIGGEITWSCQGNGTYIFYLKLYKDCTVNSTVVAEQLVVENYPGLTSIPLSYISQTDISQSGCGVACAGAQPGSIAVEEYLFASQPITLSGIPPANGYVFRHYQCCRNSVTNLVDADNFTVTYTATMYPLNGLDVGFCYDSSPQFEERPSAMLCSDYDLSYNTNAIDADGDSLSYEFAPALHQNGVMAYAAGYSATLPMPGPTLDPSFDAITIDPITGQMEYDAPGGLQGKWTIAYIVKAFRCGQLISENLREMQVWIIPCSGGNNIPVVSTPVWTAPAGASGYNITVNAGDLVSFTLEGVDNDVINGNPQTLTFEAIGSQFGAGFTNANAGCQTPPCATLTNSTPPVSQVGTISTTFNWQTECQHVAVQDQCANFSNSYNFIFKYKDDFCPARSTNYASVSITVIGESVLPSPQARCVNVLPGGGVELSWQTITDNFNPPSFVAYVITHSLSPNGPFVEVGTVSNINTGTYMHAGASATGPNYYQIRTRSGCNGVVLSPVAGTISSMFLTVTNNVETVALNWNAVSTPPLPSSNGNGQGLYQIFKEYPAGTWTQVGTTIETTWSENVTVCNEQVNYSVQLTDNLPCTSTSNIAGAVLNNPMPPSQTILDSVSIDPITQLAVVGWQPNEQLNVVSYGIEQHLYQGTDLIWIPQINIYGYNNTTWSNLNSTGSAVSECYRVRARSVCGDTISGLASTPHCTMFLGVEVSFCDRLATLTWTSYSGWENGVREYEILVSQDGGQEVRVGTTADSVLTFVHSDLQDLATYCYRVRAVRHGGIRVTSSSNEACGFVYVPKRPDYSYQYNVTVNETSDAIEQYIFVDSTAGYKGFEILRGIEPDILERVDFIDWNPDSRYYLYNDTKARPNIRSYYYSAVGIDSCDQPADTLNMSRTIYLNAVANKDRTNELNWNAYEGWLGTVVAQNIWRNYDGALELIATVPPSQLTYTDDIGDFLNGEGNFCYYIQAIEGSGPFISPDFVRFQEISRSNEDCALQLPDVFVPNAFVPEGVNKEFLPITVYVDYSDYVFEVYARMGQRVFYSVNPLRGWTGLIDGNPAPQGVYAYNIRFVSSNGQVYNKSGTVTLIR